jgi:RimJ/RimL family protein N-acetyltransferase
MAEHGPAVAARDGEAESVSLRQVVESDLSIFFAQQLDPAANVMAAFSAENPADWHGFTTKWRRILGDDAITVRSVLVEGRVAGYVLSYVNDEFGKPEIAYWYGREHWGRGIATRALTAFLELIVERPLFARAAHDNVGSLRVLQKCGFTVVGTTRGYANARREAIEEIVLELNATDERDARA